MANTNRRYIDKNGYQFMPMNVQGGVIENKFMTTTKWVTLGCIIGSLMFIYIYLMDSRNLFGKFLLYGMWAVATFYATRFIIFEEKFYYRMYLKLKENKITTPAEFWSVTSIDDTPDGAIMTFVDARIGTIIRLDRDTVTGKPDDFKETHYDAISDFYRELNRNRLSFVHMNLMELAENDPRLKEISKIVNRDPNTNVRRLIAEQYGYTKNITRKTLYESDYILIWTSDLSRFDMLISDVMECAYKLLDGAFIGYSFLSQRDLAELQKERHNVAFFDATEATLTMSKNNGQQLKTPFTITDIKFCDGTEQKITKKEMYKINKLTSDVLNGTIKQEDLSIKQTVYIEENKNNFGVDFVKISKGFDAPTNNQSQRVVQNQSNQPNQGVNFRNLENGFGGQSKNQVQNQNVNRRVHTRPAKPANIPGSNPGNPRVNGGIPSNQNGARRVSPNAGPNQNNRPRQAPRQNQDTKK